MRKVISAVVLGCALSFVQAQTFPNGPSTNPSFFPIAVWLQSEGNAVNYKNIGVNLFVGLWQGPTQGQLQSLKNTGMPVICDQNAYALANLTTYGSTIVGWMHNDEPDNAQWNANTQTYDPCIDTAVIQSEYAGWRAQDSTRPVYLNLGQGVSYINWVGRGACSGNTALYPGYIRGTDIVSYDIYPVNSTYSSVKNNLWYVPKGVDSLRRWGNDQKPVWCWIECTAIDTLPVPTPHQVKAEVWMALIHGAKGIGYFCHSWYPTFKEAALLADAQMKDSVAAINAQVKALAPALNSPTIANGVAVLSSNSVVPVDVMVKAGVDSTYLFAASMRNGSTTATFTFSGFFADTVTVVGENRTIAGTGGRFSDIFNSYDVHLYRLRGAPAAVESGRGKGQSAGWRIASTGRGFTASALGLRPGALSKLSVYSVSGKRVRTLAANAAGRFVWDGQGERGGALGSGVYVARLDAARTKPFRVVLLP